MPIGHKTTTCRGLEWGAATTRGNCCVRAEAAAWAAEATVQWEQAETADQIADRYVLLTVLFASVLFFAGIAGKFQSRLIDIAMLALGLLVLLAGVAIALTYPMQLG